MPPDLVDRHDVGMPQTRRLARLAQEPIFRHRAGTTVRRQHLDRHKAIETALSREMNDTHAAATQFTDQFVVADDLPVAGGTFTQRRSGKAATSPS